MATPTAAPKTASSNVQTECPRAEGHFTKCHEEAIAELHIYRGMQLLYVGVPIGELIPRLIGIDYRLPILGASHQF